MFKLENIEINKTLEYSGKVLDIIISIVFLEVVISIFLIYTFMKFFSFILQKMRFIELKHDLVFFGQLQRILSTIFSTSALVIISILTILILNFNNTYATIALITENNAAEFKNYKENNAAIIKLNDRNKSQLKEIRREINKLSEKIDRLIIESKNKN